MSMALMLALLGTQASPPASLPPPWEARETIQQVRAQVTRVSAALGQLQVLTWQGTGASNYVAVAESARKQVAAIGGALDRLALEPERLSLAIHVFLAMQQVEGPLDTLARGVEKFQGAAAAHDIEDATNGLLNQREKIVKYVLDLVRFFETTTVVARRELESCRQQLWKRASEPIKARPRR